MAPSPSEQDFVNISNIQVDANKKVIIKSEGFGKEF